MRDKKETDTAATSVGAQEKERHGCNECHKKDPVVTRIKITRDEDGDTIGKEVR